MTDLLTPPCPLPDDAVMQPRRAAAVIAAAVFVIGAVLLFLPLSVGSPGDEVECGSAWQASSAPGTIRDIMDPVVGRSFAEDCEDARSSRKSIAYPLMGVSFLALAYLQLTSKRPTRFDAPSETAPPTA
jgi:hypothetical protein